MHFDTLDQTEESMNRVLSQLYTPNPPHVPVLDHEGNEVCRKPFRSIDIFKIFNDKDHPGIYNGLLGAIVVVVNEDHVRLFRKLEEVKTFLTGLKTPCRIMQGPVPEVLPSEPWWRDLRRPQN